MFRDYPAKFRTEDHIADHAIKVRRSLGIDQQIKVVPDKVVNALLNHRIGQKGKFELIIFDAKPLDTPGFVTFDPPKMHLDVEIWDFAKYEDPFSNFVIAHELGHLFLHNDDAKAFSATGEIKSIYGQDERSAEWQANIFAYHFLAPTHIVASMESWSDVREQCNLSERMAKERFNTVSQLLAPKKKMPRLDLSYQGEACLECANFTLVRNGTCLKCDTCGATTGCS